VLVLFFFVNEPATAGDSKVHAPRQSPAPSLTRLPRRFFGLFGLVALLTAPRFGEVFVVLKGAESGLGPRWSPVVLVVMNVAYAATAYPVGKLSDHVGRTCLLCTGYVVLAVADLVLAAGDGTAVILAGAALFGINVGLSQGLLSAMVADAAPANLRGTAFGAFHLVTALVTLSVNSLAGIVWEAGNSAVVFAGGAAAALAGACVLWFRPRDGSDRP
jgi:MFS family permease